MDTTKNVNLKIPISDWIIEIISFGFLCVTWLIIIINYKHLPDVIPTHFNGIGQPDSFGDKQAVFILPIVASILYMILTVLTTIPLRANAKKHSNGDENIETLIYVWRMIRFLKMNLLFLFGAILIQTIRTARCSANGLGLWFLPVTLCMVILPIGYFVFKLYKSSKKNG